MHLHLPSSSRWSRSFLTLRRVPQTLATHRARKSDVVSISIDDRNRRSHVFLSFVDCVNSTVYEKPLVVNLDSSLQVFFLRLSRRDFIVNVVPSSQHFFTVGRLVIVVPVGVACPYSPNDSITWNFRRSSTISLAPFMRPLGFYTSTPRRNVSFSVFLDMFVPCLPYRPLVTLPPSAGSWSLVLSVSLSYTPTTSLCPSGAGTVCHVALGVWRCDRSMAHSSVVRCFFFISISSLVTFMPVPQCLHRPLIHEEPNEPTHDHQSHSTAT